MNVDESIVNKLEHYLTTGELMLFNDWELFALKQDPTLQEFKKRCGEALKLLIDRSEKADPDWYNSLLTDKGRCFKCGMKFSNENLLFCNSAKHSLCFGCACGDVFIEETQSFRRSHCHCGERLIG